MTTLLEAMTHPLYDDLVIVMAGYKDEMTEMLNRNPGFTPLCSSYVLMIFLVLKALNQGLVALSNLRIGLLSIVYNTLSIR
jgi:putative component of membrane protein insertase Oxa1/YidC/SpoIIIJ protein YidD